MGAKRVRYVIDLIREDMAERGWRPVDLAKAARLTEQRISLFLRGLVQTAPTAKAIADAMGHSVRRYIAAAADVGGSTPVRGDGDAAELIHAAEPTGPAPRAPREMSGEMSGESRGGR